MKLLILSICFLFISNALNAQTDSLSGFTLSQLDSIYQQLNNTGKRQQFLPYTLAMLTKANKELDKSDTAYAKILFKVGRSYHYVNKGDSALLYYQKAIDIQKNKTPKHSDYAQSLNNLAVLYDNMGNYALAEPLFQEALKIRKELLGDKHPSYTNSLNDLGVLYKKMGNYVLAEPLYQEALKIRKELLGDKHPDYASSLNNLAALYSNMGNNTLAEPLYQEALKIIKEVLGDKHPEYANILYNLAILYNTMGNYALVEPLYQEALKIYKETVGDKHPKYVSTLENLAILYSTMGNYALVEPLFKEGLKIKKEVLGDKHPGYANRLVNLAAFYYNMGNYALAEPLSQEALKIYKETVEDKHYAFSLMNLAILYSTMGNYALAEPLFKEGLKIKKEVLEDKHPQYAMSLNNLAILYIEMGNYVLAEPLFQEALKIYKETMGDKDPYYVTSLNSLASLYLYMGNYALAEPLCLEALKIYKESLGDKHPNYASSLNNLAILYKDMGEYTKAESYYSQCFTVKNANLSTNFSWLPEKGKAAYWQQEKGFYEGLNNYAAQAASSYPQATVLAYNSNLISKGLLLESAKEVEAAALASKDSLTIQIFETLRERRRLINHLVSSGTGKKEIIDLYETEADSLDKILVGRLGEYAAAKRKFQITWKEVQNALSENEAAIEFARYYNKPDSQYYYMALLLRKDYDLPKLIKLGSEKAIAEIPAGKGFADLYKLIWQPIDSFLNGAETVYYSPAGYLNNIAFAALCSQGTEKVVNTKDIKRGSVGKTASKISDCTFLSERYTLHQLSITRYLAEGLKTSPVDNSLLVFGGVNYEEIPSTGDTLAEVQVFDVEDYALADNLARSSNNQSRMEYLPGTQTELQNIQKIMQKKQWKIRAFSDKNASENTLKTELKKEVPSVLHIATHGFAFPDIVEKKKGFGDEEKIYRDADNPMARCGLLLAGANHSWTGNPKTVLAQSGEDAILTALEVSNLPLSNTKLVVLSACETGLGKIQGTEGVFGLKRGFKLAGVDNIIVSLWSVPDKETMELMHAFYTDLAKTKDPVLSFEKAQKELRKNYATRPDLWAGFVLVR